MSNVRIWVHAVWGTKWRHPFLVGRLRGEMLKHIVKNSGEKGIEICEINCWVDHVHCLIRLGPKQCIADVIQLIKGEFSHWVNLKKLSSREFGWAGEYYAGSVGERHLYRVKRYIQNQVRHHSKKTYQQEVSAYFDGPTPC